MTERQRERELVLAPNEFAYVLDTTKGHINCYVGPNKTSLAQTDQPVVFNPNTKRFEHVDLQVATQLFPTAPTNWYLVLKNPAASGQRPAPGVSNTMAELLIGEKVVMPGPISFPLWPGQMARVIRGHRLERNEYLFVHIYDAARAAKGWSAALGAEADPEEPPAFRTGDVVAVRGTSTTFFIPPDGAEVRRDGDRYVRSAVTLDALEFCILEKDDGTRRYVRGEAVVFPEPDEAFVRRDGERKFPAFELSGTTGIHVKVVAAYKDLDGVDRKVGEELFITGENLIYYPRPEHVIVTYGDHDHEVHHAVAVPGGDGRYVLDKATGQVDVVLGPQMFIPDPRHQVIVRRVLTARESALLYPARSGGLPHGSSEKKAQPAKVDKVSPDASEPGANLIRRTWVPPRTLTLDQDRDGVVSVDVWPGYAVQVVDRSGARRVEVGPKTLLLAYDESLAALSLSTGTPKSDAKPMETAYLQVAGNRVSDAFRVTTSDMVECWVRVAYRVDFEGPDPSKWFQVDDYVAMVCEHGRSLVGNSCRSLPVRELFGSVTAVIRDAILGLASEDGRVGRAFAENSMRVYDVEVLGFGITDESVSQLLLDAQHDSIARAITVNRRATEVVEEERLAELQRRVDAARHESTRLKAELALETVEIQAKLDLRRSELANQLDALDRAEALAAAEEEGEVLKASLVSRKLEHDAQVERQAQRLELRLRELAAQVEATTARAQAFSPHLVQALQRLGDEELLGKLSDNFAELAAIEGRGLLETASKFLDFVPSAYLPRLGDGE